MKRPWLLPLTSLWRLGTYLKNHAYDRHLTPRPLAKPVISIGSLSAGGAGKTPVVIALAQLLARHNLAADVLSRGYGRGSGAIEQVDPLGSPARFGDEPLEIAQSPQTPLIAEESEVIPSEARSAQSRNPRIPSPRHIARVPHSSQSDEWVSGEAQSATIPVFVGAHRHAAGLLAESTLPRTHLHLLDDGFQHRRLARSLDLVILTLEDLHDHLLPAGNLREPLSSLARAHAILLREEEAPTLTPIATRHAPKAQWIFRRTLHLPNPLPGHPLAFCGIARPADFFTQLEGLGLTLAGQIPFPDHYAYTSEDISALCRTAKRAHADAFLTTAKDAVKLPPEFRARLETVAPFHIAHLEVRFLDETVVIAAIAAILNPV